MFFVVFWLNSKKGYVFWEIICFRYFNYDLGFCTFSGGYKKYYVIIVVEILILFCESLAMFIMISVGFCNNLSEISLILFIFRMCFGRWYFFICYKYLNIILNL